MNDEASLGRALIHAASEGDTAEVRALLEEGASVNATDVAAWTPLMVAAAAGHAITTHILVDAGADVNVSAQGQTALMLATENSHVNIADLLKLAGAQR